MVGGGISWISDKEEWLVDWENARLRKEVGSIALTSPGNLQTGDEVVFSEIAEIEERCFLSRASGYQVDVLDLSPVSTGLFAWRVSLPSAVLPEASIALAIEGANLITFVLTSDGSVHKIVAELDQTGICDVSLASSTACWAIGTSVAFCAVNSSAVALATSGAPLKVLQTCANGSGPARDAYELSDASNFKRILHAVHISKGKTPPAIAAVSVDALHMSTTAGPSRLLVLHGDAQLRLWAVGESRGVVLCSALVAAMEEAVSENVVAHLRVSPCQNWACLAIQGKGVFIVALQTLSLRTVGLPFPDAVASSMCALSKHSLWGYWSGPNREPELFRVNLVDPAASGFAACWQVAAISAGGAHDKKVETLMVAGSTRGSVDSAHPVFTAERQHEVWSAEEDHSWDLLQLADVTDTSDGLEELLLQWWIGRIFLCGRFSATVILLALKANGENPRDVGLASLQQCVQDFLKARAAPPGSTLKGQRSADMTLQAAYALNVAAADFTRACEGHWQSRRKLRMLNVSNAWAQHTWQPAGANAAGDAPDACPVLLCTGGVACIRPVHHWAERWWATLHFTHHLSRFDSNIEVENILQLVQLDEWRLCATAWFLSQCIKGAGIGMFLSIIPTQLPPSETAKRFAPGVPDSLRGHLEKCKSSVQNVEGALETLKEAIVVLSSGDQNIPSRVENPWDVHEDVYLSDILRGNIFVSECGYATAVLRDLALLCEKNFKSPQTGPLAKELDCMLPLLAASTSSLRPVPPPPMSRVKTHYGTTSTGLKRRLGVAVADIPLNVRTCDIWAKNYRDAHGVLRPPLATVNNLAYALKLLKHECWDAVQAWSCDARARSLAAYLAGRQLLVKGDVTAAKDALRAIDMTGDAAQELGPLLLLEDHNRVPLGSREGPNLAYLLHLAGLFGSYGAHDAEREFYEAAAETCSSEALWSSAFEKAVFVSDWDAALRAILKLPEAENQRSHLRLLSHQLRSGGFGEVILTWKLPEELKSFLLEDLRQHAQLGVPTPGSGALDCYKLLYALHIADGEYVKAATAAYLLYVSLATRLKECLGDSESHSSATPVHEGGFARRTPGGDMISDFSFIPVSKRTSQDHPMGPPVCEEPTKILPWFDQQRSALLMAISALSLSREGAFLAPSIPSPAPEATDVALPNFGGVAQLGRCALSASDLGLLNAYMEGPAHRASQALVRLEDLQKLLTELECRLALAARDGAFLAASPDLAKGLAEFGLLALALRLVKSHGLDPWPNALQPFTQLLVRGDDEGKVVALARAARGVPHAHMFVCTDSSEPLGCNGSTLKGLWQTLESAIRSLSGDVNAGKPASAAALRLGSLVAAEVLSSSPTAKLPEFLEKPFVEGNAPAWTCLLRLYMKYDRIEEAIALLEKQLDRAAGKSLTKPVYMVDFPAALVVQLYRAVEARAQANPRGKETEHLKILDKTLEGIRGVLKDIGNFP